MAKMDKKMKIVIAIGVVFLIAMTVLLIWLMIDMGNEASSKSTETATTAMAVIPQGVLSTLVGVAS